MSEQDGKVETTRDRGRSFASFRDEGLLWLVNATVFHPRGYALSLHFERDDPDDLGECTGWSLLGDGREQWQYATDSDTRERINAAFDAVKALMP